MRRARAWEVRLSAVGLGLILSWTVAGCGGGDVPDPSADTSAAGETAPDVSPAEPKAPATQIARAEAEGETLAPKPKRKARGGQEKPAEAAAPAADADPVAAAKGDASGTSELLNQANNAAAAPAPTTEGAAPAGEVASSSPNGSLGNGPPPGAPGYIPQGAPGFTSSSGAPPGYGGAPGAQGSVGGPVGETSNPGLSGGPGMEGMMGGADDLKGPADFRNPMVAVRSFLIALKAKDKDRLAEATALRSPQEASSEAHKKLFSTIVDLSISDETLAALATDLEGFQIMGVNEAKSSARLGVILQKPSGLGIQRVTVTARKEAKGWKVVDISGIASSEGARRTQAAKGVTKGR